MEQKRKIGRPTKAEKIEAEERTIRLKLNEVLLPPDKAKDDYAKSLEARMSRSRFATPFAVECMEDSADMLANIHDHLTRRMSEMGDSVYDFEAWCYAQGFADYDYSNVRRWNRNHSIRLVSDHLWVMIMVCRYMGVKFEDAIKKNQPL